MKKLLILSLILGLTFFFGCSESTDNEDINEFETLVEYLEGENGGYINNMGSWILNEKDVNLADYLVLDLRSTEHFAATPNPIAGAVNTTLSGMWDHAESATKPILVTCYSGQTASYAHALLRMKGYEVYVMKFGMSWHDASLDKWTNWCSDKHKDDLVKTASPELPTFDYPDLNTGEEDPADILDARIDAAISAWGSLLVEAGDVISSSQSYNIINYWSEADYLGYGHIDGSFQVTPGSLTIDGHLSAFDPDGGNIFYCYTGQTAAASIAYLTVLGYDVKSIKFGFNNMSWEALEGHKWPKPYEGK